MDTVRRLLDKGVGAVVRSGIRAYYGQHYYSPRVHPHAAMLDDALAETVAYIKANMTTATVCDDAFDVLNFASREAPSEGLILEFGVRTGSTVNHLARLKRKRTIHGFDSFEGLPERWAGWTLDKGAFRGDGIPEVADNVELVVGWFDDTLPPFLEAHPDPVALVHVDSDLYSSARTILTNLAPRIRPGTIIVFNEYFNYPNWQQHEFKAFQEYCSERGVEYEYLCWGMYEVAVKILSIDSGD